MNYRNLGNSDIKIAPIVFGGNVFGWSADKPMSFALLDAFLEAGFLNALNAAERVNVVGDTLILSTHSGDLARFVVTKPR